MDLFAEVVCSESAMHTLNEFALKKKLNQIQLASMIPGLIHNHVPTSKDTKDCVYCNRAGNIFNEQQPTGETNDIISRYRVEILEILKRMETELLNELNNIVN